LEKRFLPVCLGLSLLMSISTVASNEVVIIGLNSNRVLSGVVEIPVELHAQTNVEIDGVYFFLDGEPSSSIMNPRPQPPKPPIFGRWLTTEVSNGWHTLQAFAEYPDQSFCGHDEYSSPPIRVQVFNPIVLDIPGTYGGLDTGVPFAFPIKAFVAATNATWKVTISTVGISVISSNGELNLTISTNESRILRVLTGVTTNGTIDTVWDRKDANGISVLPAAVDFKVETAPIDGSAKSVEHRIATLEGRAGQPDGQGSITFQDGAKYVGEFRNNQFNGQGTFTWPVGSIQHGEWRDGDPYRVSGIDISPDGTKEVGTWNYDGSKSGGTITWKDGREYKGDWKIVDGGTDLPDGNGSIKYPDGRMYVGQFHDGKMNGTGKMTYPDGKVEDGLWKDGKFVGASTSP
jgi:hypothetical protein